MSNPQSAFEIRLALLGQAQSILQAKSEADNNALQAELADAIYNSGSKRQFEYHGPSTAPTTEEIIAEAVKLNNFVSTKE
jgi:hypothetical protein